MERSMGMLEHYVGTYILQAREAFEDKDLVGAERARANLIKQLEGLKEHFVIKGCLDYLRANQWGSLDQVNLFEIEYERLVPTAKDIGDTVKRLFS